jgi:hypothetical protein
MRFKRVDKCVGPCRDMGAHIDGFIAVAAHSLLLQPDSKTPVEGEQADVLQAASTALEAALRLIRPGKLVSEVSFSAKLCCFIWNSFRNLDSVPVKM